ncbi:16335_t:CDS:1, partial [Racocetra fulgida]
KYLFPSNESPQIVSPGDIVFITNKYVVDNSEECVAIAYARIINTRKPKLDFDITNVPIYTPHCMITVCVNHNLKKTEEFFHFGADCVEYNLVTRTSNNKIEITILYNSQFIRFKYLDVSGINIKINNIYIISDFIKFFDSDKMMIEATDINFQKSPTNHPNAPEISSDKSKTHLIIDIISDNINSSTMQTSNQSSFKTMFTFIISDTKINSTLRTKNQLKLEVKNDAKEQQGDYEEEKEVFSDEYRKSTGENEEQEDEKQPKKRKR